MKTRTALLAALAALAANAVQMATENWVSNRLTEATAPIRESVAALNSATQKIQAAVGLLAGNVYTKQETDDKIVELAPAPGNYEMVSNRAMSAIQAHQTLQPATNYTDRATNEVLKSAIRADAAALSAFASTGAVSRAAVYGTPTRWTDATGCVWEASVGWRIYTNGIVAVGWTAWSRAVDTGPFGTSFDLVVGLYENEENPRVANAIFQEGVAPHWGNEYEAVFDWDYDFYGLTRGDTIRAARDETNLVGRVALTIDIPDTSGYTTPEDVTAAIREQSLGGIWDETLQVWWTPRMRNGSLTYEATTNVNLNAEN